MGRRSAAPVVSPAPPTEACSRGDIASMSRPGHERPVCFRNGGFQCVCEKRWWAIRRVRALGAVCLASGRLGRPQGFANGEGEVLMRCGEGGRPLPQALESGAQQWWVGRSWAGAGQIYKGRG